MSQAGWRDSGNDDGFVCVVRCFVGESLLIREITNCGYCNEIFSSICDSKAGPTAYITNTKVKSRVNNKGKKNNNKKEEKERVRKMEQGKQLKEGGRALEAFPSLEDDVGLGVGEGMEESNSHFAMVELTIRGLGELSSPELAKAQVAQLAHAIQTADIKEEGHLAEEVFGRKLYKNVTELFLNNLGKGVKAVVDVNYPLDDLINRMAATAAKLKLDSNGDDTALAPQKPDDKYSEIKKKLDVAELQLQREARRVTRSAAKSGKGKSSVSAGESQVEASALSESESDFEREKTALENKIDRQYIHDYELWKNSTAKRDRAKKEVDKTIVLLTLVEGMRAAMQSIVGKIRAAVSHKEHVNVKQKLTSLVRLKSTGEEISNPLDNGNLAGIYAILKMDYAEATLVRFNSDFQLTMKASISMDDMSRNPWKAVQKTDDLLATWVSMGYWAFMTPDMFFTNVLLNALPPSQFQQECVKEVNRFLERKENDAEEGRDETSSVVTTSPTKGLPTYNFLRKYIKSCEESARHRKQFTSAFSRRPNSYGGKFGNVETAALSGAEYATEIGRDKQVKCKDVNTGQEHPYTATKEQCPVCYGKSANPAERHVPRCFVGICNICSLYGHKSYNCSQAPNTYVKRAGKQGSN